MNDERNILQEKLRRLHLDDPDPMLRARTLGAIRRELDRPRGAIHTLMAWRTEALYAAAILAGLVLLPQLGETTRSWDRQIDSAAARPESDHGEAIVRELGLAGDLAHHVRNRLALQRDLGSQQRKPNHALHRHEEYLRY